MEGRTQMKEKEEKEKECERQEAYKEEERLGYHQE
jgi:hypothetical protein